MLSRLAPALVVPLLLAACGAEEPDDSTKPVPLSGRVQTEDGAASLVLPEGWIEAGKLDGPVTLAAVDATDDARRVYVTEAKDLEGAEAAAVYAASALSAQKGHCLRERRDTTFGATYSIFDCSWLQPEPFKKVMVAIGDEEHGAMVLFADRARNRREMAELVQPVLDSWQWND